MIRRRILMRYLPFLVSKAFEFAFKKAKDEMGDEAFLIALDQIPTRIKDKDGFWTLPSGTSQEEVTQFIIQLRERKRINKEEEK